MDPVISINTLAYEGYGLTTALEEISNIGAKYVEIGFTKGYTDGLTEAYFSEAFAQEIHKQILDLGLSCIALSAHTDLSTEESIDELKRRIDFGKKLGVKIVNTKVGPKSRRNRFEKNIDPIANYAESMNIIIGLENPAERKRRVKSAVDCFALKPLLEPIYKPMYKDMRIKRAVS